MAGPVGRQSVSGNERFQLNKVLIIQLIFWLFWLMSKYGSYFPIEMFSLFYYVLKRLNPLFFLYQVLIDSSDGIRAL